MDASSDPTQVTAIVFLDIAVIILAAGLTGALFRRIHQPAVVGEVVAGIMLGPTLLGALPGDPSADLFPGDARTFLKVLGDLGLIIFIFLVGLRLDLRLVRRIERAVAISLSSIALPFALGLLLAAYLHPSHDTVAGSTVDFLPFALFIGVSMSITAFPVLARILVERGIDQTPVGSLVLACAAADDVLGWSLLAVALAVLGSNDGSGVLVIFLETIVFVIAVATLARRLLLNRITDRYRREGTLTPWLLATVLAAVATSAWITEEIGISFVFGAFVMGIAFPRPAGRDLVASLRAQLDPMVMVVLLPIFFVLPGLSINLRDLGLQDLGELGLIMLAACGGKFVGGAGMTRLTGSGWREASAVGTLLNTRGVMELVVLNIGWTAGVLDLELYTLLVAMAVLTTLMTGPLLERIYPGELVEEGAAPPRPEFDIESGAGL